MDCDLGGLGTPAIVELGLRRWRARMGGRWNGPACCRSLGSFRRTPQHLVAAQRLGRFGRVLCDRPFDGGSRGGQGGDSRPGRGGEALSSTISGVTTTVHYAHLSSSRLAPPLPRIDSRLVSLQPRSIWGRTRGTCRADDRVSPTTRSEGSSTVRDDPHWTEFDG